MYKALKTKSQMRQKGAKCRSFSRSSAKNVKKDNEELRNLQQKIDKTGHKISGEAKNAEAAKSGLAKAP